MAENINIAGRLHSTATGNVVAGANEIYDDTKGKKQSVVNQETDAALDDRYTKSQTYNKTELNSMITTPNQEYVSVTATDQTTAATDVLPATGSADTTYRVGNWDGSQFDASVYSEYAWDGSQYVHLSTKTQVGEVFDISAYHATGGTLATYADLAAALDSNNGGGVPQSLQKGGMSVKFVHTSDNKYVKYRLMSDTFNTTPVNWEGVDDEPTANSNNFVKSGGIFNKEETIRFNIGENLASPIQMIDDYYIACSGNIGSIVSLEPVSGNTWRYAIVNAVAGDIFYIRGTGGNTPKLYCFVDSENKIIKSSTGNLVQTEPLRIVAPTNTSKLIINDNKTGLISYKDEKSVIKMGDKKPVFDSPNLVTSGGTFNTIRESILKLSDANRTSEVVTNVGYYYYENGVLSYNSASSWKHKIFSIDDLAYVETNASISSVQSGAPALIFLSNSQLISENVISVVFGQENTTNDYNKIYRGILTAPSNAKYVVVNYGNTIGQNYELYIGKNPNGVLQESISTIQNIISSRSKTSDILDTIGIYEWDGTTLTKQSTAKRKFKIFLKYLVIIIKYKQKR